MDKSIPIKNTRIGVYGVCLNVNQILTVRQIRGPYKDKYDLPGGGLEFGESTEQALQREFAEEVCMKFHLMEPLVNLTVVLDIPATAVQGPYIFYQIGMIYRVHDLEVIPNHSKPDLPFQWVKISELKKETCSPFLWKTLQQL